MNVAVTGSMTKSWDGQYRVIAKCPKDILYGHSIDASGSALTKLSAGDKMAWPVGRPTFSKTVDGSTSQIELHEL